MFAGCGGRALLGTDGSAGATASAGSSSAGASNSAGSASAGAPSSAGNDGGDCQSNQDCTLVERGCCGACEPVTAKDLVAINFQLVTQFRLEQCPDGPVACGPCPTRTEYDSTLKYFRAVCTQGRCDVIDVRGATFTSCVTTADCTLRAGVDCCEHCQATGWVPVNETATFCDVLTSCPPCASAPPPDLKVVCQASTCRFAPPLR